MVSSWRRSEGASGAPQRFSVASSAREQSALSMILRFGWALADQLLSSATNFLLALFVARTVTPRDLGAFSVAYATFTLSLGAVRAIAGELLVVRHSHVSADAWRHGIKGAAGTALMAGSGVGLAAVIAGWTVEGSFGTVLAIVGLSLPFLLVQDVWRFAFFARGRGGDAFLNDLVWAIVLFAAFGLLYQSGTTSVTWLVLAWAGAGVIAAIVGTWQLRTLPCSPRTAVKWLRSHSDLAPRFLAEFAVGTGVTNVTLFAIGAIAGLGELGRLRAGEIALGPLNVLFAGVGLVATAEGVRLLHESPRRLVQGCRRLSGVMAAGVLTWGALLLLLPRDIGESVLRDNWDGARTLAPLLLLALAGYGSSFGALIGLRSLAAASRSLRAKCIDGAMTAVFCLIGAYWAGAIGVAWGTLVTGCLRSVNAWWQFSSALHEHERRQEPGNRAVPPSTTVAHVPSSGCRAMEE
jgi:O-antigen/teichoic acid export membrane protein